MAIFPLKGKVQNYAWGGKTFIPELLSKPNNDNMDCAEYWLGVHPRGESDLQISGQPVKLSDYLEKRPEALGEGQPSLPFLFKILDVDKMLSIQCHPNKAQAEVGFALENEAGVSLADPIRNFKDNNHKPEAMFALSDFWLLHGFLGWEQIKRQFEEKEMLADLIGENENTKALFEYIMSLDQAIINERLQELRNELLPKYEANELEKSSADFWAARALLQFCTEEVMDRGVLSIYMMNVVHMKPGEVIFQEANLLHAYLEGQNVEIMANSDNVFRAGLTAKHIDIPLLIEHLNFDAKKVVKSSLDEGSEFHFPVDEFKLEVINDSTYNYSSGAEIIFCTSGKGRIRQMVQDFDLEAGDAFFVEADTDYQILIEEDASIFRAFYL